jgi:hypothetical protein
MWIILSQDQLTLWSCILSNLKPPVDGSNCAPAACHALGNVEDGHIAIREEPHNSFYFLFGERTSLSSHDFLRLKIKDGPVDRRRLDAIL